MNRNDGAVGDARKRRADYLRDIANQTEDHNNAMRDEISSQRNADWADIYDDRPTRAEIERDNYDDWAWARERDNR